MYKVFRTEEFERRMRKLLTNEQQQRVDTIEEEIKGKGFTGDPLGLPFLREKRIDDKRVYFLVYEDLNAALMVSVSDKKAQQVTINTIKALLPEFRELVERLSVT